MRVSISLRNVGAGLALLHGWYPRAFVAYSDTPHAELDEFRRLTVDLYAAAFPDMHREVYALRSFGDHVLAELSLNGTHKGDLVIAPGTISPTGKQIHAPCCDVFHLKDGKVFSFHCYVAVPILLEQLGVFMNLQAALRH